MRNSRFLPVALLAVVLFGAGRRLSAAACSARQDEVTQQYRVFTAALAAIDREYVEEVPLRPPGLRRHRRHAEDARPAFELLRPAQLRADARAAGRHATTASASRFSRSTATSPSCRSSKARPPTGRGSAAATSSPASKADDRRQDDDAGRQGDDQRGGGQAAEGAEGHHGQHLDQAPRLRRADRPGGRARRGQHRHRPRRVHDRQGHRLHEARRVLRDVERRGRRGARRS